MSLTSERLRELRTEKRKTLQQMATETGLKATSISNYETGLRIPRLKSLEILANYFNVDTDYLLGIKDIRKSANPPENLKNLNLIPIYSNLSNKNSLLAGQPTDHLALPFSIVASSQAFSSFIEDDSMEPEFHKDDLLIFQETSEIKSGEIGLFNLNGKFYCRRLKKLPDGNYWLLSDNPKYDPIPIRPEDNFETLGQYQLKITK